jgi:hypothetical protein
VGDLFLDQRQAGLAHCSVEGPQQTVDGIGLACEEVDTQW